MRVSSYAVARPAYYDRNASSIMPSYASFNSPHAATIRYTYTVASGKKALIETSTSYISRYQAATISGYYAADTRITLASGSYMILHRPVVIDNTLGPAYFGSSTGAVTLYAGETISAETSDGSTGGTVTMILAAKGTLFDA